MAERTPFTPEALQHLRAATACLNLASHHTAAAVEVASLLPGPEGEELACSVARLHELLNLVAANLSAAAEQSAELEGVAHG